MTPRQYAKREILAGRHPDMTISPSSCGNYFWVADRNFRALDKALFTSRAKAEKERSKAHDYGCRFIGKNEIA